MYIIFKLPQSYGNKLFTNSLPNSYPIITPAKKNNKLSFKY